MIETSAEIGELAKALVAFQGMVNSVGKGNTAKVEKDGRTLYSYKYADLASVIEATQEARSAAGLAVMQFPAGDANGISLATMVIHSSGQWIRGEPLTLKPVDQKPQTVGSLVTYLRRYEYSAALGIATEEDDDGKNAQGNGQKALRADKVPAQSNAKMASADQIKVIHVLKEKLGGWTGKDNDLYKKALAAYKNAHGAPCMSSKELTFEQADNLLKRMQDTFQRQAETVKKMEAANPIAGVANDNREPGSDDGDEDDGVAPEPELLTNLREAAKSHWGKKVADLAPQWLQMEYGVAKTEELTKYQARHALERLLSGNVL